MYEDLVPLSDREFSYITKLLFERFGIFLSDQKRVLVAGRLSKRLRELGLSTFTDYIEYLSADKTGGELSELINRITTNHSFFFRERDHFDFLSKTVLPEIEEGGKAKAGGLSVRIWSAGCATGEEVYSISMLLKEHYGQRLSAIDPGLLATDISLAALTEAKAGEYAEAKLRELPVNYRNSYFVKKDDATWAISEDIRSMVMFKRLNLMADSYPMKGLFDAVFCRNVMIYFNPESREKVVNAIYRYVKPGGYLFIGHSESLNRETCPFEYVRPAVYRKGA
ncbi:MAG TPA: protein-glutamate O-methyltransferase CheR [Treponemataceae bacterium]|mgnify:FL=1|nr:protein-glutamate O-methyltransferase CheR [Treponemataceae bacterium]HPS42932.1 protein-glutamate O-methyltransferase CheR [Treponemataceae bacterium]